MTGIDLDAFGDDAIVVRGVPAHLRNCIDDADVTDLIERVIPWLRLRTREAGEVSAERAQQRRREVLNAIAETRGGDPAPRLARRWIGELLELGDLVRKPTRELSLGERMKCELVAALIHRPKVLFLDEPTLGLDVIARSELWDVIRSFKGRATVILTTHYLEEARELSDRISVMKDGRLLFVGTADEILKEAGESDFEKAFVKLVKEGK